TPASTTRYARLRCGSRSRSGGIAGWVWVPVSSGKPPPSPGAMTPYPNPKPGLLSVPVGTVGGRRGWQAWRGRARRGRHHEQPNVIHHPCRYLVVQRRQHLGIANSERVVHDGFPKEIHIVGARPALEVDVGRPGAARGPIRGGHHVATCRLLLERPR